MRISDDYVLVKKIMDWSQFDSIFDAEYVSMGSYIFTRDEMLSHSISQVKCSIEIGTLYIAVKKR